MTAARSITPEETYRTRGTLRVIDVREPHEFAGDLGRIAGAESVPLATLEHAAATWDRSAELVMVCRSGGRSGHAAALLGHLGFLQVMNMIGGMEAYCAADLPVERGSVTPATADPTGPRPT